MRQPLYKTDILAKIASLLALPSTRHDLTEVLRLLETLAFVKEAHFCLSSNPYLTNALGSNLGPLNKISYLDEAIDPPCHGAKALANWRPYYQKTHKSSCPYLAKGKHGGSLPLYGDALSAAGSLCLRSDLQFSVKNKTQLSMVQNLISMALCIKQKEGMDHVFRNFSNLIAEKISIEEINVPFFEMLHEIVPFDRASLAIPLKKNRLAFFGVVMENDAAIPFQEKSDASKVRAGYAMETQIVLLENYVNINPRFYDDQVISKAGMKTSIIVPLVHQNKAVAALCLAHSQPNIYKNVDVEFLKNLSLNMATLLERQRINERLFKQRKRLQEQARDIAVARDITTALLSTRRMNELLKSVITQIRRAIPCEGTNVLILNADGKSFRLPRVNFKKGIISLETGWTVKVDETTISKCLEGTNPVLWKDISKVPGLKPFDVNTMGKEGISASLLYPLYSRRRPLGVLSLGFSKPTNFSPATVRKGEALAQEVALALDRAMSISEEKRILQTLQRHFLPKEPPKLHGWEIETHYSSATRRALVGGDFYDFLVSNDTLHLVLGDVCGKGIDAAATTLKVRHVWRSLLYECPSINQLALKINRYLLNEIFSEKQGFVALFMAEINLKTGNMKYLKAGQPPPIFLTYNAKQEPKIKFLEKPNAPPLGIFPRPTYRALERRMAKNDMLLLYTDGLSEAGVYNNKLFGEQGIADALMRLSGENSAEIVNSLVISAKQFADSVLHDDIAVLLLRKIS